MHTVVYHEKPSCFESPLYPVYKFALSVMIVLSYHNNLVYFPSDHYQMTIIKWPLLTLSSNTLFVVYFSDSKTYTWKCFYDAAVSA